LAENEPHFPTRPIVSAYFYISNFSTQIFFTSIMHRFHEKRALITSYTLDIFLPLDECNLHSEYFLRADCPFYNPIRLFPQCTAVAWCMQDAVTHDSRIRVTCVSETENWNRYDFDEFMFSRYIEIRRYSIWLQKLT